VLKIFLWFVSTDTSHLEGAIKILERQHNGLEIVGAAASGEISDVDRRGNFDVLLFVGTRGLGTNKIVQAVRQLNLPEEKLLGDWIVFIPGFTLEKYRRLQRSRPSIFSMNCFGGMLSHVLGLPFRSPFVNLSLSEKDFLKFLQSPRAYLEQEPHFEKLIGKSLEAPDGYPLLSLGNIFLNMMHYKNSREALDKWNDRKRRINWQNLFVTMCTEDEKFLRTFDALPYEKKVCFVPFKSDLNSAWYINPAIDKEAASFTEKINNFSFGKFFYYDVFDMLLYGKKTQLIEM